jgi:hypothetical protein
MEVPNHAAQGRHEDSPQHGQKEHLMGSCRPPPEQETARQAQYGK